MNYKKIDRFPYWFDGKPYPGMGDSNYRKRVETHLPLVKGGEARLPLRIRCYDNREVVDRYTVVFTGRYRHLGNPFWYLGMSPDPYHPQGFGALDEADHLIDQSGYSHLGTPVDYDSLSEPCQDFIVSSYIYIWRLQGLALRSWVIADKVHVSHIDGWALCGAYSHSRKPILAGSTNCEKCIHLSNRIVKGWTKLKSEESPRTTCPLPHPLV